MMKWPPLSHDSWKDTLVTLHMWTQIVGKIKLKQNPFINQWWEVAFYLTPRGLATGRIPYQDRAFEVIFDFIHHTLFILTSDGKEEKISLHPQSVAQFYTTFMKSLAKLGIEITINPIPSETTNTIPFSKDTKHVSYDKAFVATWHHIQLQSSFIFDKFRSPFRGKSSPVQFYWGSFDLNTARFSGKKLPDKKDWPKGYKFMRYAENEENFSSGFWPGDEKFPEPAYYAYMYPAPKGYESARFGPAIAYYNKKLSLCILPYEEVRKAKNPEKEIMNFLTTTYTEFAKLAGWNIQELTGPVPMHSQS